MGFLRLFGLILTFCLFSTSVVFAFSISHNGSAIDIGANNFTFAKSIWKDTPQTDTFSTNNSVNYLYIDDIYISGSLLIVSPLSSADAEISLYRLDGSGSNYSTVLVKAWSGSEIIGTYYVSSPGKYLLEARYPGELYPHISIDFYPDNDSGACTNLVPSSTLTCDQTWLPAHYRKEVGPWIEGLFTEIKHKIGTVEDEKAAVEFAYSMVDSAIDAGNAFLNPGSVITKKVGQLAGAGLKPGGSESIGFAVDQAIQHASTIADLGLHGSNPFDPLFVSAWTGAVQQLVADGVSITGNTVGIMSLNDLEEQANELDIARSMLKAFIHDNYGDWDALVTIAGFEQVDNPTIYEIIDGFANNLGYSNSWYGTNYNPGRVEILFTQGSMGFGDWVFFRKSLSNPYDDVDYDGVKNLEDSDPNDPSVTGQPSLNRKPLAVISTSVSSVNVNSSVTLNGSSSYDPDGDVISSYTWVLTPPAGSNAQLSSTTGELVSFTTDIEGGYLVQLEVSDGDLAGSTGKSISAVKVYSQNELVILEEGKIYIENIGVSPCGLDNVQIVTVPAGEVWTDVKFVYSSPRDIILLASLNEWPDFKSGDENKCALGYMPAFNADFEQDFYEDTGQSNEWSKTFYPGDKIYISLFSSDGFSSSYGINGDVNVVHDLDGDLVPDDRDVFPNDPTEQYDSDNDGVGDNLDKFDNDPAAWQDTDGDECPDSINGQSETGLILDQQPSNASVCIDGDGDNVDDRVLDLFTSDISEWQDSDLDGVGDNADKFDNDSAASLDNDGDLHPDLWNFGKNQADSTTGLTLDLFPNDINEWSDSDLDGVGDNSDWAINDPTEWVDSDGDLVGDNADVAPSDPNRSTNIPPIIDDVSNQTLEIGETLAIPLSITDEDGDIPSLQLLNVPSFVSLSGQTISVSSLEQYGGDFNIAIRADDGFGGISFMSFFLKVLGSTPASLTVTKYGTDAGQITSDPSGISCGEGCVTQSYDFAVGDTVILTATDLPGGAFVSWGGGATNCDEVSGNICTVTLSENKNISAFFSPVTVSEAFAYYPLDGDALDNVSSFDGVEHNGTSYDAGFFNQAASFDGINDYLDLPEAIINETSGSVSLWFNSRELHDGHIFSSANTSSPTDSRRYIYVTSTGVVRGVFVNTTLGEAVISQGQWYHAVLTWDATQAAFYLNGNLVGSGGGGAPIPENVNLGSYGQGMNSFFNGLIDEVRIYDHALTLEEVQQLREITHSKDDLDADGTSDILLRNTTTGQWRTFTMGNMIPTGQSGIVLWANQNWVYQDMADYDADGDSDILLRNRTDGNWRLFTIQDGAVTANTAPNLWRNQDYSYQGSADFDADGDADILLRNTTDGFYRLFTVQDGAVIGSHTLATLWRNALWQYAGAGDFDNDGDADILIRNTDTGDWRLFTMENGNNTGTHGFNLWKALTWTPQGIADYDQDGDADLLMRDINGYWQIFAVQDGQVTSTSTISIWANPAWVIQSAQHDLDGDGDADVLLRSANTGLWRSFSIEGLGIISNGQPFIWANQDWQMQ